MMHPDFYLPDDIKDHLERTAKSRLMSLDDVRAAKTRKAVQTRTSLILIMFHAHNLSMDEIAKYFGMSFKQILGVIRQPTTDLIRADIKSAMNDEINHPSRRRRNM